MYFPENFFPKAISKKQFLFQLQMVISPVFYMAYPKLIPEKIERDDCIFIVLLMDFSHQRTEVTIKIRKKAGIPDQTVDE